MKKAALLTTLILSCMSPAVAQRLPASAPIVNGPPAPILPPRVSPGYTRLISELRDLREIALALREEDGGTLTTEHRASIQTQIDAAYRRYHNARRNRQARAS
jgi:hypothetical protein